MKAGDSRTVKAGDSLAMAAVTLWNALPNYINTSGCLDVYIYIYIYIYIYKRRQAVSSTVSPIQACSHLEYS